MTLTMTLTHTNHRHPGAQHTCTHTHTHSFSVSRIFTQAPERIVFPTHPQVAMSPKACNTNTLTDTHTPTLTMTSTHHRHNTHTHLSTVFPTDPKVATSQKARNTVPCQMMNMPLLYCIALIFLVCFNLKFIFCPCIARLILLARLSTALPLFFGVFVLLTSHSRTHAITSQLRCVIIASHVMYESRTHMRNEQFTNSHERMSHELICMNDDFTCAMHESITSMNSPQQSCVKMHHELM